MNDSAESRVFIFCLIKFDSSIKNYALSARYILFNLNCDRCVMHFVLTTEEDTR